MKGAFGDTDPANWPGFTDHFQIAQRSATQLVVGTKGHRDPSADLKDLLALPVAIENVTFKHPGLNDVFLRLTSHELRE